MALSFESLFVVTRRPRHQWRDAFGPFFWFTHASSAAAAVRKAVELLPRDFGPDRKYAAPRAERVTPGGPARRL